MARILLVEDEQVSLELIAALLASRGHEVDTAVDGFGALRLAREKTYDLAFVDYHLPEMDGYALARLIRSPSETSDGHLKMIAITADRFGLAARRGVDTIFDRVLTKPIQPDALFAIVEEFLGPEIPAEGLASFLVVADKAEGAARVEQGAWRVRGSAALPSARVFPPPNAAERRSLERCFHIVDSDTADCLVLLRISGLPAVEAFRAQSAAYLLPLVVLDPKLAAMADVSFKLGDNDSWIEATAAMAAFTARAKGVADVAAASQEFDMRLAAHLSAAGRPLVFCRDETGRLNVPYTAGFSAAALIEAVKRLASRGLIKAKTETGAGLERRLVVTLTAKAAGLLAAPATDAPRLFG